MMAEGHDRERAKEGVSPPNLAGQGIVDLHAAVGLAVLATVSKSLSCQGLTRYSILVFDENFS